MSMITNILMPFSEGNSDNSIGFAPPANDNSPLAGHKGGRHSTHTHSLIIGPVHSILKWVDAFAAAIQPAPTFRYIIGNNNETQRKQSAARQPESVRRFSNLSSQRGESIASQLVGHLYRFHFPTQPMA